MQFDGRTNALKKDDQEIKLKVATAAALGLIQLLLILLMSLSAICCY